MDNAENITYEPNSVVVRNWFRQVGPSGEQDREDHSAGVTAQRKGRRENFGLMQAGNRPARKRHDSTCCARRPSRG